MCFAPTCERGDERAPHALDVDPAEWGLAASRATQFQQYAGITVREELSNRQHLFGFLRKRDFLPEPLSGRAAMRGEREVDSAHRERLCIRP
jgi:hypothetical protein